MSWWRNTTPSKCLRNIYTRVWMGSFKPISLFFRPFDHFSLYILYILLFFIILYISTPIFLYSFSIFLYSLYVCPVFCIFCPLLSILYIRPSRPPYKAHLLKTGREMHWIRSTDTTILYPKNNNLWTLVINILNFFQRSLLFLKFGFGNIPKAACKKPK